MRRIAASIAASLLRQPSGAAATGGLDGLLIGDGEPATRAWLNFLIAPSRMTEAISRYAMATTPFPQGGRPE
jgi:hypothetical protein